ncbi:PPR repeat [Musa troglodytarum]|uniref:HECT-type E3 ubiquitin transferase n=1 Tax=Musa troglodytarum TaxID=320322 RepID=A0A9E7HL41_9LILI|nr:PPR repeat [Musa troglodytarum]
MVATPFAVRRPSVLLHLGALIAVGDGEAQVDFVLAAAADSVRRELNENAEKVHLSSSSASGTTILTVLQALSFLVASLQEKKISQILVVLFLKALQGIPGSQRLQIRKAYDSPQHLPSAHACFNRLDLPECTSEEQLRRRLLLAINEANEGFGIG